MALLDFDTSSVPDKENAIRVFLCSAEEEHLVELFQKVEHGGGFVVVWG